MKEGIAHIEPFLTSTGDVWVGSAPTPEKTKRAVYIYFTPEMTTSKIMKGVYVEQRGSKWVYAGDIPLDDYPKVDFEDAKVSALKVEEWKEIEVEIEE
ncbi:hypothetical protein IC620_03205 [Hazenella sp. IB182357]|uniref:Uncharacterized protein n=1 Tax=Polycladospora coralii TaxID=2771432 RepID=A0A926NA23_9BACL|nr:hypothetical protein [Polycladospora coralii]MBD1371360.1 hypothetical protein [Polycladospora coralii]